MMKQTSTMSIEVVKGIRTGGVAPTEAHAAAAVHPSIGSQTLRQQEVHPTARPHPLPSHQEPAVGTADGVTKA